MGWTSRLRKPETGNGDVVGLDLTSSRARAVYGPTAGMNPRVLSLDDPHAELPLAISLENRTPIIGRDGAGSVRRLPHAVCRDYLPALGQMREWRAGKHRLSPAGAVELLANRLRAPLAGHNAIAIALPSYLTAAQVVLLRTALETKTVRIVGTASAPLALAVAVGDGDFATVLVVDADDHALTWSVLSAVGEEVRSLANLTLPGAAARIWLDRLLDAVSDRCVRICRRDPRDTAAAEQAVYEQLGAALNTMRPGHPVGLTIRTTQWYQELSLACEELEQVCAPLARLAVDGMRAALAQAHTTVPAMAPPDVLLLTAAAARLPGLVAVLSQYLPEQTAIRPLPVDAVAQAAHGLAARWRGGELPHRHLDVAIPRIVGSGERGRVSAPRMAKLADGGNLGALTRPRSPGG